MTKLFFIIGKPLSHSLSPLLHNYWFKKYKLNAKYSSLEINEVDIENVLKKIRNKEILGINVTLPYKQKVIPFLDFIINDAKECNSVNTIYLDAKGNLVGDNTDVYGMVAGYLKETLPDENKIKKTLVLGAGGVAPSIILALIKSNIKDITVTNRTYEKALFLKRKFQLISTLEWTKYKEHLNKYDYIINATSLGLNEEKNFDYLFENLKKKRYLLILFIIPNKQK